MIFLGGGLGSVLRYYLSTAFFSIGSNGFPWPTFFVNIAGSFLIGFLMALYEKEPAMSQNLILFSTAGFCGGFTTFSTFSYENYFLIKEGEIWITAIYITASVFGGLLAAFAAFTFAKS